VSGQTSKDAWIIVGLKILVGPDEESSITGPFFIQPQLSALQEFAHRSLLNSANPFITLYQILRIFVKNSL
jgi:hypothetical protein